jgi:hypothetical protein
MKLRVSRRAPVAPRACLRFAGEAAMRVREVMIPARIEPVRIRVGPNDSVTGAVQLGTMFGPEEEAVLVGR